MSSTQAPGIDLTGASREWREDTGTQNSRESVALGSLMEKPQYPGSVCLLYIVEHGLQLNHGGFMDSGKSRWQT